MTNSAQSQIIELLKRSQKILIIPSAPPDGDSLGSALALYLSLKKLNKEITVACSEPIPETLQFLPNIKIIGNRISSSNNFVISLSCRNSEVDKIENKFEDDHVNIVITPKNNGRFSEDDLSFNKGEINFDLIITVDTAELSQLDHLYEENVEMFHQIPVINIDHHISNTHFGKLNHVDIMASSTTELLLPLLEDLAANTGQDLIDADIATLLLAGVITDTGSFQNANTTPRSFDIAAKLISYGARQQEIIKHVYKTKQLSQLKLWGRVLSKIQTDDRHKIVWSTVSQQDYKDTQSTENETGDIIDELMTNAPNAEIIALIKESVDGDVSVSLRTTTPTIDAAKIAQHFGGGGHTQAAGYTLADTNLRESEFKLIEYLKQEQAKRLQLSDQSSD